MSPAEIAARVGYRAVTAIERRQHRRGSLAGKMHFPRALVPALQGTDWRQRLLDARRAPVSRFFSAASDRPGMQRLFCQRFEAELRDTFVHAARARENRFEFFGQEFRYDGEIDWQRDPVTGASWPAVYHADVPVHGGDVGFGDVKHVWELNRQQYLIDLAKSFYLTDSGEDLRAISRLVSSWIAGNPYATGVNWSCALEPAFRVWSWLWAYHLTCASLDDDFHVDWLRSMCDHGRFLSRHLEHYTSPYNHLIGEAAALYALGLCFPEFRDASRWRRQGRHVLEQRLPQQFYADGGSVEQSTFYHHATTGFYLLAAVLARVNGEELSGAIWGAIERALEFSMHLSQPDGYTPSIGGADDGKPIRMEHLPFWDFRPYLAIGAVLFHRSDFKEVAGRFHEDALWLLGREGLETFDTLRSAPPLATSLLFRSSGYAVTRSGWDRDADYVCVDVGEQAAGMRPDAIPNSMHGHADALSVIVWFAGRPVLVDSGLYGYNCGGEWEAHFRETAAHNTARIDGKDQARHIGKMAWSHSYRTSIEGVMMEERQAWVVGSHDGYARGPEGVIHRRTVWRRPGRYVLIHDEFEGAGRHAIEVNYQFAPGEVRLSAGGVATFDDLAELRWIGETSWVADARQGGPGPADGWICNSLGVRQPAPRLTLRGTTDGSGQRTSLLTVVADGISRVRVVDYAGVRGLAVLADPYVDWIAAQGVGACGPMATDARLAIARVDPDGRVEESMVRGGYLRLDQGLLDRMTMAVMNCPAAP